MLLVQAGATREPEAYVAPAPPPAQKDEAAAEAPPPEWRKYARDATRLSVLGGCLLAAGLSPDPKLAAMLTTFSLAGLAGFQAVLGVPPALHSPLMSVTNAISGMTAVGGIMLLPALAARPRGASQLLGAFALLVSSVNIAGGFLVTRKMLGLFRRPDDPKAPLPPPAPLACALAPPRDPAPGARRSTFRCTARRPASSSPGSPPSAPPAAPAASASPASRRACSASRRSPGWASRRRRGVARRAPDTPNDASMTRPRRVPQARLGNTLGVAGVAFGVASTVCSQWLAGATAAGLAGVGGIAAAGAGSGLAIASRVGPTELPQTVAGFHSLVGAAAVATAVGEFLHLAPLGLLTPVSIGAIVAATYLGAITTTGARFAGEAGPAPPRRPALPGLPPRPPSPPPGSLVAFGKLNGALGSAPVSLPRRNLVNALLSAVSLWAAARMMRSPTLAVGRAALAACTAASLFVGAHATLAIGGADVPVVITCLNSASGWALCAEGFMLSSTLLTTVGALIGFSGALLTQDMCVAMNRDIGSVLFKPLKTNEGGSCEARRCEPRTGDRHLPRNTYHTTPHGTSTTPSHTTQHAPRHVHDTSTTRLRGARPDR